MVVLKFKRISGEGTISCLQVPVWRQSAEAACPRGQKGDRPRFLLRVFTPFRVPHGAGSGFTPEWSSCPQRVTLKKNTFPLPALPQEVAGPQEFLGHFTCGSHSSLGTLICHFTACWQKSSSANSKKPQWEVRFKQVRCPVICAVW